MDIRHEVVTPARAKQLISTFSERNGFWSTSVAYHNFVSELHNKNWLKRKHVDPRYRRTICVSRDSFLVDGVELLTEVILKRRPTELYICVVDDADEVEDIFADIDLEPFPKIHGAPEK
jgi:hypothetical protein